MRKLVVGLVVSAAFVLVNTVGALAFVAVGKLALHLDPASHESHISSFIVAISAVAAAVASAFPIFGRAVPWVAARLEGAWPERQPPNFDSATPPPTN